MPALAHHPNWINGSYSHDNDDQSAAEEQHQEVDNEEELQQRQQHRLTIINPATETPFATITATPLGTVTSTIASSLSNFAHGPWRTADATTRFGVLSRAATLLRARLPEFIALETRQTGRPVREMRAQLTRIPEWFEYYASLARTHEGRVTPFKGPVVNTLTRLPLGVVVQITPWNHPLLIASKKLAAALAAGNSVIVKPSELAPLSVLQLGSLLQEAGLPDGTLQIVCGLGRETGKFLCASPLIAKIDLTGGLATYTAVAEVASRHLVPITAELGGKAPVCFFPSVGVEKGVRAALFASFIASGQTCVTGSRLLVHREMYEEFVALLVQRTRKLRFGDPLDEGTQIGSVISRASVERCADFVKRAVDEGGKVLCGGKPTSVDGKGFFFEPTLIECRASSNLACNEVFGPVIAVIKCESEEEIIEIANATSFALGASVWTNDFSQAHRVAASIDAGIVWINGHHLNDPSSPWGGFKESGIGKECGVEAYESYTKVKSTIINYGQEPSWFDDEVENARYG